MLNFDRFSAPLWAPLGAHLGLQIDPKSIQNIVKNHFVPTCPQETTPRGPKTAPRGSQTLPRGSKIAPRGPQDSPKRPSERPKASQDTPAATIRPRLWAYKVASLRPVICCPSMLNHIQFITHFYIGSSQETITNIQNFSRLTYWSLRAFKPPCL